VGPLAAIIDDIDDEAVIAHIEVGPKKGDE
jgi:hypothetical protein